MATASADGVVHALGFSVLLISIVICLQSSKCLAQIDQSAWFQTQARLTRLLSGDSEQKRTALAEIRNLRTEPASLLAVPSLIDKDEIVRATAASSVLFLPETEAARVLLPLLDDKKPFVRCEAAHALGHVGNWSATGKLTRLLNNDRDREVRSAAAVALGNIGDPSAIDSLLQVLRKRPVEDDEFLRRSAARAVGQIFDLRTGGNTLTPQNFLPPKFKDLGTSGNISHLPPSIDLNGVVTLLSQILQNPNEADDTRRETAFALGAARQPASAAVLRSFLNNPDPYLAEISKEALLKLESRK